jgi:hypothetical protein
MIVLLSCRTITMFSGVLFVMFVASCCGCFWVVPEVLRGADAVPMMTWPMKPETSSRMVITGSAMPPPSVMTKM